MTRERNFEITWPLFSGEGQPFPEDPQRSLDDFEPRPRDLAALSSQREPADSADDERKREVRGLRGSLPPEAPDWMRAARALADWLELRIAEGAVKPLDEATIARTWAAYSLGGLSELELYKIVRVVQRAHGAIRETPRAGVDLQAALAACAGVLHAGLPGAVRTRMPLERVVQTVRRLREQSDGWAALVEATADLAGWRDYARAHAASILRALIESPR